MKTENTFVKWVFFAFVLVVPLACKQIGSLSSKDVDGAGQRIALGKRYLNLSVRVANKESGGGGGVFLPEFFRLMIDGNPAAPENMSENNVVNGQSSEDVTLSFCDS